MNPLLPRQDLLVQMARLLDALSDHVTLPLEIREWLGEMRSRELIQ